MSLRSALLCLSVAALPAYAQLNPQPPSSLGDGVQIHAFSENTVQAGWATSPLAEYRIDPGSPFVHPTPGGTDVFGRAWGEAAPDLAGLNGNGGTLRAIFLGGSDNFLHSAGYTYLAAPDAGDSFTFAFDDGNTAAGALAFGDCANISLAAGDAATFDLWLSVQDRAYTVFAPENSVTNGLNLCSILWTQEPLLVSTYMPVLDQTIDIETWVVSLTETNQAGQTNTYRFAVQQFESSGGPLAPVPEPATYGLFAALALATGVVLRRRRR